MLLEGHPGGCGLGRFSYLIGSIRHSYTESGQGNQFFIIDAVTECHHLGEGDLHILADNLQSRPFGHAARHRLQIVSDRKS
ncbi:unnamed protein product [marine sediment metagenome]|uniref:Uncharacterized protein n=1 Tax=marine sediment metagenome TaxID=412755 RepID=X0SWL4_9ZZZZ